MWTDNTVPFHMQIFDSRDAGHTTSLNAYYFATDDKFYLTDGVNTVSTAAQTWAVGDKINLVLGWGASGLAIYKNGSATPAASGATFTPPACGTYAFIGTNYLVNQHLQCSIMGHTVLPREVTAAEAAAIGTAALAAAGVGVVDYIPYLWTTAGDSTINSDLEYAVAAGVPGSTEAETEFFLEPAAVAAQPATLWLSRHSSPYRDYRYLSGSFVDTVTTAINTGSSGSTIRSKSVDPLLFIGQNIYAVARLIDAGADLTARMAVTLVGQSFLTDYVAIDPDIANYRLFGIGGLRVPQTRLFAGETLLMSVSLELIRTTGGASNVTPANIHYLPSPLLKITNSAAVGTDYDRLGIRGREAHSIDDLGNFQRYLTVVGEIVELKPNAWNVLMSLLGNVAEDSAKTRDTSFIAVYVTPRWNLL
jgi:hypothetical protein